MHNAGPPQQQQQQPQLEQQQAAAARKSFDWLTGMRMPAVKSNGDSTS